MRWLAFHSVLTGDERDIMRFSDVCSPSPDARYYPAYPTDSNGHNFLDDSGNIRIAVCCMDGTQPCTTCLWWRQRDRTSLSNSSLVGVSRSCAGTIRKARGADRCGTLVHPRGLCGCGFRNDTLGT